MNAVIPPAAALGFSSLCLVGILFLILLVVLGGRHQKIDSADGCLVVVWSVLLAVAAVASVAYAL